MADLSTMDGTGATKTFTVGGVETVPEFIPTPQRVSEYLEMDHEQVLAEMQSVEGRQRLHQTLIEYEEDLRELYPTFSPESLQAQLDLVGETLLEKEQFLRDVDSPEKKGMFRRVWESMKAFPKRHPVITSLLVVALLAAGAWRMGWLPKFDGFGFGLGEGGGGASGGVAEGAAEGVAETVLSGPELLLETAKKLVTAPDDFVTIDKTVIFRGIAYDRENLQPLLEAVVQGSGIDTTAVRIVRDPTSRFLTEAYLKRMLVQDIGVKPENLIIPRLLLGE
ncbi:MAG: hypothetical protein Greene101449_1066 [Candidatus Peregrinibacteria bacterium Greene1014_49]|nr:MAG: hypothetical protein Greene101449_1066 [Candidatus Peregrinibacteria bacterium Greene1014_49]